jgi:hypothetical protein
MKAVTYNGKKYDSITEAAHQGVEIDKKSVRDVADALGLKGPKGYLAVYMATKGKKVLKKSAKKHDVIRRIKNGQNVEKIATKTGIPVDEVVNTIKETDNVKLHKVMVLRKKGESPKDIAKCLGISVGSILNIMKKAK